MAFLALAFLFTLPTTHSAQASNPESLVSNYIYSQLHRLKLSANQNPKFKKLLSLTSAQRHKVFRDLGIKIGQPSSYAKLMKLRSRFLHIAPRARKRAAAVLSKAQLAMYDVIRMEVVRLLQKKLKA